MMMSTLGMMVLLLFVVALILGVMLGAGDAADDASEKPQRRTSNRQPNHHAASGGLKQQHHDLAQKKGATGEQIVKVLVLSHLDGQFYRHFHNLIIPSGEGSTQIDNIVVSPFGIFVIEAKHYSGWIYGQAQQAMWTQTLSPQRKCRFQNPLRQNHKHIMVLTHLLRLPKTHFHSVVVFTQRECQLKTAMPDNVLLAADLVAYMTRFNRPLLDEAALQRVCAILSQEDWQATPERVAQHQQYLSQKHASDAPSTMRNNQAT